MSQSDAAYAKWREVIAAGNDNFELHHTLITLVYYSRAIELARALVKKWPVSRRTVEALLVSYHNLAELYERENSLRLAWQVLVTAKQQMMAVFCKRGESACTVWGCRSAHQRLSRFEQQHGSFDRLRPRQRLLNPYQYDGFTSGY